MRLAFVSPLPPSKSGIADYSATLLTHMRALAEVDTYTAPPERFDAAQYDAIVYQLGNNPQHSFAYEMALAHPGIVVLHEANLHHLIADITIRRGDWDAYLSEVEFEGGAAALDHAARRVRTLEQGPDYDGLPMLRRILSTSRGVIAHSNCVTDIVKASGFTGPVAKVWHGAWIETGDRATYRQRLGLEETTPLIGLFGYLKPYKRVAESLRAFRRVLDHHPEVRLLLAGEVHPELPLDALLDSLDLRQAVRPLGFTAIEDFSGYLAACDIVLNLRFPTVGESSGTLLRAFGMAKPVIVSDVGSFREYPDSICLKAPVDQLEEDYLVEYLDLLLTRPDLAQALGARAQQWVREECSWPMVAERYIQFLQNGTAAAGPPSANAIYEAEILSWCMNDQGRQYALSHLARLAETLRITPPGGPEDRILEMGAYLQITPALHDRLGYGDVRGCYYGPAGKQDRRSVTSADGRTFNCLIDLFDAEKDRYPYEDESFSTVLCCELIEHLFSDPMHLMIEVHRILKPGGHMVLTTPNITSLRSIAAVLDGYHPMLFPQYIKPSADGTIDARHNREYAPREIATLMQDAGFEVTLLETAPFQQHPGNELKWVADLLMQHRRSTDLREDGIFAVGRKIGPVGDRYPAWLYT